MLARSVTWAILTGLDLSVDKRICDCGVSLEAPGHRVPEKMIRGRREVVPACHVSVRQCHIPPNHVEARMTEDPLEGEHVVPLTR